MNSTIPVDLLELKASFETWRTNRIYVREPILSRASFGGESERAFFAFFTPLPQAHAVSEMCVPSVSWYAG